MTLLSDIVDPPNPVTINLPSTVSSRLVIDQQNATSLTITGLQTLNAGFRFSMRNAPKCRSISFPDLVSVAYANPDEGGEIRIHDHLVLQSFSAPLLQSIDAHNKSVYFMRLPALNTLNLPALQRVSWGNRGHRAFLIKDTGLAQIEFDNFAQLYQGGDTTNVFAKMHIIGNPNLISVVLDGLAGPCSLFISANPALTFVSLGGIGTDLNSKVKVYLNGNSLPVALVNSLITQFYSGYLWTAPLPKASFIGGTNAAPTGSALAIANTYGWPHN